jgi:outer membrane immunogenic protein
MKHAIILGVSLLALGTAPVMAADIPVKARPVAPIAAPAFTWSGCYIGANGGWVGQRAVNETRPGGNYLTAAGVLAPPNVAGTGLLLGDFQTAIHSYDTRRSGWEAGAQVGCNHQVGMFVLGVEADWNWSDVRNTASATYLPFPSANPLFTISTSNEAVSTRMDWFSTVRARGGWAFDRWLVFGTAGLAIGHFRSSTSVVYGSNGTSPVFANAAHFGSAERTRLGFAVGGGVEYAIDNNWSFKAEYLYLAFNPWSYSSPLTAPAGVAPGYSWTTSVHAQEHIARVGINYRFGGAPLVMARY